MTIFQNKIILLIILISVLCLGCDMQNRPKDLPKLYPSTLTFTYENGDPIGDALVSLHSEDPLFKWIAGGHTNSAGKVKLTTNGLYPGIAEGKFHIVIAKTESERNGKKMEETETISADDAPGIIKVYTFVEKKYAERKATPLVLDVVSKGKNDQTFQCGKPTRVLLTTIIP